MKRLPKEVDVFIIRLMLLEARCANSKVRLKEYDELIKEFKQIYYENYNSALLAKRKR